MKQYKNTKKLWPKNEVKKLSDTNFFDILTRYVL